MLAVQNSDNLFTHGPFEQLEKCMTFKDIFPGFSRTLSFNFEDFPGPKWFSRTFQEKNPKLSRRRGDPVEPSQCVHSVHSPLQTGDVWLADQTNLRPNSQKIFG